MEGPELNSVGRYGWAHDSGNSRLRRRSRAVLDDEARVIGIICRMTIKGMMKIGDWRGISLTGIDES
jgi:hypothetical protein